MSLAAKISAGFLILVVLMVALSWHQLAVIYELHAESRSLAQIDLEASSLSLGIQGQVVQLRQLGQKFLVLRDPEYAAELEELRRQVGLDIERLRALDLEAAERETLDLLTASWAAYAEEATSRERHVLASDESVERAQIATFRTDLDHRLDTLTSQLEHLLQASRVAMEQRVLATAGRVERARQIAWGATLVGLAVAALIAMGIVRSLVRPLRDLGRGARQLAGGNLDHRVPVTGGPELEALADDFNSMARHLGELDLLKKDFVANVSHDLKAPLASIQEATEVLLEEIPGPLTDDQRRLLELNLESGKRLTRMIGDLLDLSRLETGTVEYDLRPHDLRKLSRAAADGIAALAADKRLEVEENFPDLPAEVECDGAAIVKVAQNLLSNAVKFSPEGATIGLRLQTLDDYEFVDGARRAVRLQVSDCGPGVPDEHKQRIFERFHRVDASGPAGTGLGLAIAREIVNGHGGELWVEDAPGGGSVFQVVLPRKPPSSVDEARASFPASSTVKAAAMILAAGSLVLLGGCKTHDPPPVVQLSPLGIADLHFANGDFEAASAAYEGWLAEPHLTEPADRVYFRLGLMHVLPGSPLHDLRRGREYFATLIERYPRSPFRSAAEYLIALQREVKELRHESKELRDQLEEIKRIDLGGG